MAFVPYVSSFRFSPATSTRFYRKILPSTTSTYVYSRPVATSHSRNATFSHRQPMAGLIICESAQPEPKDGHHKKTHLTIYQRSELEKTFGQSQYITPHKRGILSQNLGIPEKVIKTWFKNRRVKWRKQQRKRQTEAVSTAFSVSNGLIFQYFGHVPYPNNTLMLNDARMLYDPTTAHQD